MTTTPISQLDDGGALLPTDQIPINRPTVTDQSPEGTNYRIDATQFGGQSLIVANDEDVTVPATPGTTIVLYTALTAPRTVTLPAASSDPMTVIVKDVFGQATVDNVVALIAVGGDTVTGGNNAIGQNNIGSSGGGVIEVANDGKASWVPISEASWLLNDLFQIFNNFSSELGDLEASLGGTDGDGNVYTIEYDPNEFGLGFKVALPNGDEAHTFVTATANASLFYQTAAGNVARVQCSPSETQVFFQANGGDERVISLTDAGITINGVTIDPTQPWPGG